MEIDFEKIYLSEDLPMKLYPEMFISIWHLAVPLMTLIAFIAMLAGGYDRKTVLKSTGGAFLSFYIFVTVPVGLVTQQTMYQKEQMIAGLDQQHAQNEYIQGLEEARISGYTLAFKDEDGDSTIHLYAGNYHESQPFTGTLTLSIYNENNEELYLKTYSDITLQPGEKKKIDIFHTTKRIDNYKLQGSARND